MHSTSLVLALMATSALGIKINFQRYHDLNCQQKHFIGVDKLESTHCKDWKTNVAFTSYNATLMDDSKGDIQKQFCTIRVFEQHDCKGDSWSEGDLNINHEQTLDVHYCSNPKPMGEDPKEFLGRSVRVECNERPAPAPHHVTQTPTPSATLPQGISLVKTVTASPAAATSSAPAPRKCGAPALSSAYASASALAARDTSAAKVTSSAIKAGTLATVPSAKATASSKASINATDADDEDEDDDDDDESFMYVYNETEGDMDLHFDSAFEMYLDQLLDDMCDGEDE